MNDRRSTVMLRAGEMTKEHSIEHAEVLLKMPNNGGWVLDDPDFEMTEKNGIRIKKGKGASQETEQEDDNK